MQLLLLTELHFIKPSPDEFSKKKKKKTWFKINSLKEISSQTDEHLVILSSEMYVYEDKMTNYQSV